MLQETELIKIEIATIKYPLVCMMNVNQKHHVTKETVPLTIEPTKNLSKLIIFK